MTLLGKGRVGYSLEVRQGPRKGPSHEVLPRLDVVAGCRGGCRLPFAQPGSSEAASTVVRYQGDPWWYSCRSRSCGEYLTADNCSYL
eukprot:scaffold198729_cov44-Prasinocladus_malaysianus.AAC.2